MTDITAAMSHSTLLGGSIADRRINCPRSYALEQLVPPDKGSVYSRQGTALHEMMARILGQGQEAEDLLPFTYTQAESDGTEWTYEVTDDEWEELGQVALDALDETIRIYERLEDAPFQMYIEQSCAYPGVPGAKGTSDLIWRCGTTAGIWDWKFGRNYVNPENNSQLMFYLYSAIGKFPEFFAGVQNWKVYICQPRVSAEATGWALTEADLGEFNRKVHVALALMPMGVKAPIAAGAHCKFARCKAICPLHGGAAVELGAMMAALPAGGTPITPHLDLPTFVAKAMELAEMAEDWAKTIAGLAQSTLENGVSIPGWKLVAKKSSGKTWTEEDEVIETRLKAAGLDEAAIIKRSLVTPTQALTAAKKLKVEIDAGLYEQKPSSGSTLTREDDPRPAVRRTSEEAAALGAELLATMKSVAGDTN
jgi:hypothetical protein